MVAVGENTSPVSDGGKAGDHKAMRRRERQIGEVLLRHGLIYLVDTLGVGRAITARAQVARAGSAGERVTPPADLRSALQELGPTFIKVGQLLSTRGDLLPDDYREELAKLQDADPPVALDAIREVVEHELGGRIEEAFESLEPEPLAAGSIGQVHAATLFDGSQVVVKVRRPGVVEQVQLDLEILQNWAARASRRWAAAEPYDIPGLIDEFAAEMRAQLDYLKEARNAERFAANFAGEPAVRIPQVFWDLTTSRVLTLERLAGMKVTDLDALDAAGIDRHALAERAAQISAKMIFEDGWFHGDPHPGNFFIEDSGRLGIIDFGIVGALEEALRDRLQILLLAVSRRDPDRLARALIALRASSGTVDRRRLRDDLAPLMDRYLGEAVGTVDLRRAIADTLEVARRHRLRVPRELSLLLRAILLEEGIVEQLDPEFSFTQALGPYARRQLLAQLTPSALRRRLGQAGADLVDLAIELPTELHRALEVLADGDFEVHLRAGELEPMLARGERLANRIAASVIAAAVINALAELSATRRARAERRSRRWI
jgi:ubiquinone biosynthesis protein